MSPGVSAEDGGTTVLGKQVSDLQSDVTVGDSAITGTLTLNDGWESGPLEGPGYYIALKLTGTWSNYDSVLVGLDPSEGTGLVELINDPDKNVVCKITDKSTQKFVVVARDGATIVRKEWSLSGLELVEPVPFTTAIFKPANGTVTGYNGGTSGGYEITQQISEFSDNTELAWNTSATAYTGSIKATTSGSRNRYMMFGCSDEFIQFIESQMPAGADNYSVMFTSTIKNAQNQQVLYSANEFKSAEPIQIEKMNDYAQQVAKFQTLETGVLNSFDIIVYYYAGTTQVDHKDIYINYSVDITVNS